MFNPPKQALTLLKLKLCVIHNIMEQHHQLASPSLDEGPKQEGDETRNHTEFSNGGG